MGKIKKVIEIANTFADDIVLLIDKSLNDKEKDELQASLFEDLYQRFISYDTKTISELHKNLKIKEELLK